MKMKRKTVALGCTLFISAAVLIRYSHAFADALLVFAYVLILLLTLSPLCRRLEKAGFSVSAASGFAVALIFIALLVLFVFILPYLVLHTARMVTRCMPVLREAIQYVENLFVLNSYSVISTTKLTDSIVSYAAAIVGLFVRGGLSAAAETGRILFSVVITYYALKERAALAYHLQLIVPSCFRDTTVLALRAGRNAVMGYFSGLIKTCLFVGSATCIALFVLGVSDAILLGLLMGLLEIIPYIGPVLGAIPILLSAASLGINKTLLAAALIFLIQQAENSFVGPYFTASSTAVHPLAALLSVYILGSLFGFWGILFAVPCVVVMQSALWSFAQFRNVMNT